jgi:hypothetical protein
MAGSSSSSTAQSFEFSVGVTPTIVVRNPIGTVTVQPGAASQVGIQATKTIRGVLLGGNGLDAIEKVTVSAEQSGDRITVTVKHPKQMFMNKVVTVEIVVTTPDRSNLDLQVDAGNIELRGGSGAAIAQVDAGNVRTDSFTFLGSSRVEIDAGNATLDAALAEGALLDVRVDAGNARLHLPHDTAANLDAAVDAGSLKISGWNVEIKHEIVSHKARGPLASATNSTLRVRVDAGNISLAPRG